MAPGSLIQVVPPWVEPQRPLVLTGGVPEGPLAELTGVDELAGVDDDGGAELTRTIEVDAPEMAQVP